MAVPTDSKFSNFADGGDLVVTDIVVGLRNGVNTRFTYNGGVGVFLPLAGGVMTGAINMSSNAITGLPAPTNVSDATNKAYVDSLIAGVNPLTTKGDLFGYSTTNARVPVGSTNGQVLQVNSAAAVGLSYSTATYPTTATSTGSFLYANGTNFVQSTSLWPNTVGASGKILQSDGTSNGYSTPTWPTTGGTAGSVVISDGTNKINSTSLWVNTVGSAGKIIRSDGTINTYSTSTFADTYLINTIPFAGSANTIAGATLTSIIDASIGNTQGNILYRNATDWVVLAPGTSGQFLQTLGAGANVQWAPGDGAGTVTSITAATGITLTPNPITSSGTVGLTIPVVVSSGGTGITSATAYAVLCGGTTSTGAFQSVSGLGSAGEVLTSNGAGALPTWQAASGGSSPWTAGTGTLSAKGGGAGVTAGGNYSLAYGNNTTASNAAYSMAIGNSTVINAASSYSLVFGNSNTTTASGFACFVHGQTCEGGAQYCFVQGNNCASYGDYGFAHGVNTYTYGTYGFAFGNNAQSNNNGSVVWGDSNSSPAQDSAANQWVTTFRGGYYFYGVNNRTILTLTHTTSAVNSIGILNNTTGSAPAIFASGTDTNVTLQLNGQGTGGVAIVGVATNSNAATREVGEYIESVVLQASAVTVTNTTATNITSISLTAGDWDVWGNITYVTVGGTAPQQLYAWTNDASATIPDGAYIQGITLTAAGGVLAGGGGCIAPYRRYSLASTTTIYLSGYSLATSGNSTACGRICARRAR